MARELTEKEKKIAADLWQKVLKARKKETEAYHKWLNYHLKINPIENMWIDIDTLK